MVLLIKRKDNLFSDNSNEFPLEPGRHYSGNNCEKNMSECNMCDHLRNEFYRMINETVENYDGGEGDDISYY